MSFNQKAIAAITLITVLVTCAIAFVCFKLPYNVNEWIALGALVLSEIILGGTWFLQLNKGNDVFPLTLGTITQSAGYVLFTLVCTLLTRIGTEFFVLLEIVGLAGFVIFRLFGAIAVHHVKEMSKDDEPEQKIERVKPTWR